MAEQTPIVVPAAAAQSGPGLSGARKAKRGKMPVDMWNSFGEEFRSLRTRVAAALDERHKIVLVTSALPQEGKTTVSATLARSFAQMEWRTLLVDADMRKPTMHTLFGIDRAPGLSRTAPGAGPGGGRDRGFEQPPPRPALRRLPLQGCCRNCCSPPWLRRC